MTRFRDVRQDARLEAVERRVRAILDRLGMEDPVRATPAGVSAHVADLARSGQTIHAVKAHMQETGVDLHTARDVVAAINPVAS